METDDKSGRLSIVQFVTWNSIVESFHRNHWSIKSKPFGQKKKKLN